MRKTNGLIETRDSGTILKTKVKKMGGIKNKKIKIK